MFALYIFRFTGNMMTMGNVEADQSITAGKYL